ncbi:unnamed protein product [Notodromas monacha]|uniref:Histone deacetylase complex subunit SAP30L n=1 Tax=Notodromas monacha TaxID=399045 RepID=A0A7R9GE47_9CRUS|nr:unnamed protein product [Notodromas monacha]CAG0917659.1 unnamed protein product [Notodromas monacha]
MAGSEQVCCLFDKGKKCRRLAGNASYNRRIQKLVFKHNLRLHLDKASLHLYICDHHKNLIQESAKIRERGKKNEVKTNGGDAVSLPANPEPSASNAVPRPSPSSAVDPMSPFDWAKVPLHILKRYRSHFKLPHQPGISKQHLAQIVSEHFNTWKVSEVEVLTYFVYMLKTNKNKLDRGSASSSSSSRGGKHRKSRKTR